MTVKPVTFEFQVELDLEMLVFEKEVKPEYPEKTPRNPEKTPGEDTQLLFSGLGSIVSIVSSIVFSANRRKYLSADLLAT